jgi:hypothetical protein
VFPVRHGLNLYISFGRNSVFKGVNPSVVKAAKLTFQMMLVNAYSENKNSLSQAISSNHSNVFTFILPFSEGRASEALESYNNMMLFLHRLPHDVLLLLLSYYSFLHLCLYIIWLQMVKITAAITETCPWTLFRGR